MEILEAIRRSPQADIPPKEEEDGYLVLVDDNGVVRQLETRWELAQNEAFEFSLLLYNGAEPERIEITKHIEITSQRNYTHLIVDHYRFPNRL